MGNRLSQLPIAKNYVRAECELYLDNQMHINTPPNTGYHAQYALYNVWILCPVCLGSQYAPVRPLILYTMYGYYAQYAKEASTPPYAPVRPLILDTMPR